MGMASLADLSQTALTPTWTHLVTQGERALPIFPYAHNYAHAPAGGAGRMPSQSFTQPRMTPFGHPRPRRPVAPPQPPPTTSSRFLALFDPLGLFSRPELTKKSSKVERYPTTTTTTTEAPPPPLVYFPEGGEGECGDYSSGGFDAYSFVGFILGVVNIVAQVATNVNNNLNNNNNNNNDNNNNLDNINSATSNANQNNMNTVNIPPGGRRRRDAREERAWRERSRRRLHDEEAVAASVALHFLRAFWLLRADGFGHCALRIVCEANSLAVHSHGTDLALVFAEVFTEALAEWSPAGAVPRSLFTSAGARGRSGHDCSRLSSRCSTAAWEGVKKGMGDDQSLDLSFLKEEGQGDLLEHIMTHAEDFAKMGLPDISSIMDLGEVVL